MGAPDPLEPIFRRIASCIRLLLSANDGERNAAILGVQRTLQNVAKDKSVEEVLDGMFKKNGLGYIVISKKNNAYDGLVQIKQGPERGYEKGKEPK